MKPGVVNTPDSSISKNKIDCSLLSLMHVADLNKENVCHHL